MTDLLGRSLVRIVEPTEEPLCLEEAKRQLRVVHDEDDSQIEGLIRLVRDQLERVAEFGFLTQTWRLVLDCWWEGVIRLPKPPLQSVTEISYVDTDGNTQVLPGTEYTVYPDYRRVAWNTQTRPELQPDRLQRVQIDYVVGWTSREEVPETLRHAMKVNLTNYYDNRGSVEFDESPAFERLWLAAVEDWL